VNASNDRCGSNGSHSSDVCCTTAEPPKAETPTSVPCAYWHSRVARRPVSVRGTEWMAHTPALPCYVLDVGGPETLGQSTCRRGVALSRKGAKSLTHARGLRSTRTKARTRVSRIREPRADLKKKLEVLEKKLHTQTLELTEARGHLSEALEQQTATSEVLGVISSSPGKLEPVFQAMLANATRLCEAEFGNLFLREGDAFRAVAVHGPTTAAYVEWYRREPVINLADIPRTPLWHVAESKEVLHVLDLRKQQSYLEHNPRIVALVESAGVRTILGVPMLKEGELIGAIFIYRQEVRPFTDKRIELVQNFANQAVIAIENTRLLNELRQRTVDLSDALEQQTATSEVLQVISSSPGALQPVFNAMLENALRICEAKFGAMFRFDGEEFDVVALMNAPPALTEFLEQRGRFLPQPGWALYRIWKSKQVLHTVDDKESPVPSPPTQLAGARTHLAVPMLKENELVGAIFIYRQEVRPFTDKQIDLVRNFAAQAVIAIENTRLLNELRESLQQQKQRPRCSESSAVRRAISLLFSKPFSPTLRASVRPSLAPCISMKEGLFGLSLRKTRRAPI
jgi:GAF domain-containing protein